MSTISDPVTDPTVMDGLPSVLLSPREAQARIRDDGHDGALSDGVNRRHLEDLPNELLCDILGYLDVNDVLSTSRTSHRFRRLSLAHSLHVQRLRQVRYILPPLLTSPSRPTLADLVARSIVLTKTTVLSRRLARSLLSIRLARRLAARPSAQVLVERAVLLPECLPGASDSLQVAPGLVASQRATERDRVKDRLCRWIGSVWKGEVRERQKGMTGRGERAEAGTVRRLQRFWEQVSREEAVDRRGR